MFTLQIPGCNPAKSTIGSHNYTQGMVSGMHVMSRLRDVEPAHSYMAGRAEQTTMQLCGGGLLTILVLKKDPLRRLNPQTPTTPSVSSRNFILGGGGEAHGSRGGHRRHGEGRVREGAVSPPARSMKPKNTSN